MEHQILSPTSHGDELWCVECDPGPLGDWSDERQAVYAIQVAERIPVPFRPACLALNSGLVCWTRNRGPLAE